MIVQFSFHKTEHIELFFATKMMKDESRFIRNGFTARKVMKPGRMMEWNLWHLFHDQFTKDKTIDKSVRKTVLVVEQLVDELFENHFYVVYNFSSCFGINVRDGTFLCKKSFSQIDLRIDVNHHCCLIL